MFDLRKTGTRRPHVLTLPKKPLKGSSMTRKPLKESIKDGRTALGVWANDPQTVELCAFLGFDWIMIDMMFTGMDFADVQYMIRTCESAGITPVVRMHTNPWAGHDHRIAVDLSRLQGIGAE